MEIEQDFNASTPCPCDCLVQDRQLPLYIRITVQRCNGPIANGYADMIQSRACDLIEVVLCDPRVPVVLQIRLGLALAKGLCISIFIDHVTAQREDGRGNPWLKDKPAAEVHAADFIIAVVECNISFAKVAARVVSKLKWRRETETGAYKVKEVGAASTVLKIDKAVATTPARLLVNILGHGQS